jgi:zinc/manganese transport system ATP-binding protein
MHSAYTDERRMPQVARRRADTLSKSSASALRLVRATLERCFDAGYNFEKHDLEQLRRTPIEIRDLSVRYGKRLALEKLTGTFAAGSLTAIVGPNGAGKSTLLKALAGIVRTRRGTVTPIGRHFAYLPQQASLDRGFPATLSELVGLGAWRRLGAFRGAQKEIGTLVAEAIAAVGLDGWAGQQIADLSIGQFQRALFARLLVQDADVILLDEPFAAIDERTSGDLLQLLQRWSREGRTVVAVLHDLEQVRLHFPRTLLLARRTIDWGDTRTVLTPANLGRAGAMLESKAGPARGEAA